MEENGKHLTEDLETQLTQRVADQIVPLIKASKVWHPMLGL